MPKPDCDICGGDGTAEIDRWDPRREHYTETIRCECVDRHEGEDDRRPDEVEADRLPDTRPSRFLLATRAYLGLSVPT